jgi:hypothetical protein
MRNILLSLTTLFAISITGCLDDAQQPEPNRKVLTVPSQPELSDQAASNQAASRVPDQAIEIQDQVDDGAANTAPTDDTDPMFCNTVADCEDGYWCRLDIHRCMIHLK